MLKCFLSLSLLSIVSLLSLGYLRGLKKHRSSILKLSKSTKKLIKSRLPSTIAKKPCMKRKNAKKIRMTYRGARLKESSVKRT